MSWRIVLTCKRTHSQSEGVTLPNLGVDPTVGALVEVVNWPYIQFCFRNFQKQISVAKTNVMRTYVPRVLKIESGADG